MRAALLRCSFYGVAGLDSADQHRPDAGLADQAAAVVDDPAGPPDQGLRGRSRQPRSSADLPASSAPSSATTSSCCRASRRPIFASLQTALRAVVGAGRQRSAGAGALARAAHARAARHLAARRALIAGPGCSGATRADPAPPARPACRRRQATAGSGCRIDPANPAGQGTRRLRLSHAGRSARPRALRRPARRRVAGAHPHHAGERRGRLPLRRAEGARAAGAAARRLSGRPRRLGRRPDQRHSRRRRSSWPRSAPSIWTACSRSARFCRRSTSR